MTATVDNCRICTSNKIDFIEHLISNFDKQGFDIYECDDCGSRYTWRKNEVHENMHASNKSPYSFHSEIAVEIFNLSRSKKIDAIKKYLSQTAKYKFIIDNISQTSKTNRILEVGCSLGYLTFYFILSGYRITGADISKTAVKKAISNFGNHFVLIDKDFYKQGECFDTIYHVGTIGCVEDPIEFIYKNLGLLHSGGRILFNAPDLQAVKGKGVTWSNMASPPDLITLFDERIWSNYFDDVATVRVNYKPYSHANNAKKHVDRLLNKSFKGPSIGATENLFFPVERGRVCISDKRQSILLRFYYYLSYFNLIHRYKDDFGMFVTMTKN